MSRMPATILSCLWGQDSRDIDGTKPIVPDDIATDTMRNTARVGRATDKVAGRVIFDRLTREVVQQPRRDVARDNRVVQTSFSQRISR